MNVPRPRHPTSGPEYPCLPFPASHFAVGAFARRMPPVLPSAAIIRVACMAPTLPAQVAALQGGDMPAAGEPATTLGWNTTDGGPLSAGSALAEPLIADLSDHRTRR